MKLISLNLNPDGGEKATQFHIPPPPLAQEILLLMSMVSAQIVVQATLAQGILPANIIGRTFGADKDEILWFPAAYALTSGTFMLPCGRLGDMYGHKRGLICAGIWFALASLLAGVSVYSRSMIFFDVCRALQGTGGAALTPFSLAILGSVYKEGPRKNIAFSIYATAAPIGFPLGGVFSSLLAELSWWPWVFYITAIFCCLMVAGAFFTVPPLPNEVNIASAGTETHQKFDWPGTVTGVSGLVVFNFAWNRAPVVGWQSAQCIAPAIVGFILIVLFLYIERRTDQPLIPVKQISRDALFVLAIMALGWGSFGILIFYSFEFLMLLRGLSPLLLAAQSMPVPITGIVASFLTSYLLNSGVRSSYVLGISLFFFCLGDIIVATMPVHQIYWKNEFWAFVLCPFGMDMSFPSATVIISNLVPPEHQGIATSLIATVVYYSQSIGLGIAGTVEYYVNDDDVLKGYRAAFYTAIGLSALGLVVAAMFIFHGTDTRTKRETPEELVEAT